MLKITAKEGFTFCDGMSRRGMLKVGVLGLGGMTLPDLLRLRAHATSSPSPSAETAVVFIELAGGPTHFETYDPKPDAPIDFRGPLGAISTSVAGVAFSETMRHQAKVMDKMAVIRSIHHDSSSHSTSSHLTQTGYYLRDRQGRQNDMPSVGSISAKVRGANASGVPAYVSVPSGTRFGNAAYIGKEFNPLETGGDPNRSNFEVKNLSLNPALDLARLEDRRGLLASLNHYRRVVDLDGTAKAYDGYEVQAFEMVTGERARQAFDIGQEPDSVRDRYGRTTEGQSALLARRLVEAGVTFVTIRSAGWDMHGNVKAAIQRTGAAYDQAAGTLIADLHERGLARNVLVVATGEFGRTPRINKNAGRDHWGSVMSVMLAGGAFQMGQAIGASSPKGEVPADLPYRPENVLATIYRHLGIDPSLTFPDLSGRPRYVLEERRLIEELL